MRTLIATLLVILAPAAVVAESTRPDLSAVGNLLAAKCQQCHGREKQEGGLRLDTREAALAGGDNGPSLVPGDAEASLLIQSIRQTHEAISMPPKEKLVEREITLLVEWVNAGAEWPDPVDIAAAKPTPVGATGRIGDAWTDENNPVRKRFAGQRLDLWSLKAPIRPPTPEVTSAQWCRTPIDQFVLAKLGAAGLAPSAEADRRTLIRRLTFDLIGLPPKPDEVQAFLADSSPDAYEKLVERLLASPHYGERWGRHWLDVVRYADTNGVERDEYRPTAYRYRDYVIYSFNVDKPYDQFIREQLAGDEMLSGPPTTPAEADYLAATGFLRAGQLDTIAPIFQEEERARDQLMADLVNTTSSAFLGLTMSCANCHDHKYDPLLQADHFRLRAFFASARYEDEMVLDLAPEQAAIKAHNGGVDKQIAMVEAQIAGIVDPVRQSIVDKRKAECAEDIRILLDTPEDKRDDATREKLKPFREKLNVNDGDLDAALSEEQKQQREALRKQVADLRGAKRAFTSTWGMRDDPGNVQPTRVFFQGDHTQPREEVSPGFLSAIDPNAAAVTLPREGTTGRRTTLAAWIASPENPLTARVMVNRIWQHHFGTGLVATANDFGYSGARPSHPELLDWLACEFAESGWSVKHMHRLMLTSAVYRQASAIDSAKQDLDPQNQLFARQNLQRLDADAMRDAMLAASGRLLPYDQGKPLWPPVAEEILLSQPGIIETMNGMAAERLQGWYADPEEQTDVRSVFLVQKRSLKVPFMQAFDVPDMITSCACRDETTVAPQALNLLNSEFASRMGIAMADRVIQESGENVAAQIERAFWLILTRAPTEEERSALRQLRDQSRQAYAGRDTADRDALADVCRALLNANEFVYID